ncbi:hypothetical protein [Xylanimonas ulmi]|uniref:Alternate signal-mediated exported protein n=1 Tax=Xylanimonas ulmi TaxID=228973 RepID=A0A4Q7M4Y0_9MICO|nr:hypothetical protein [Xylanibacterium ulmi]RZS61997.1 hypothetical protein EV386_2314 [Xylanibacterium ulmi]
MRKNTKIRIGLASLAILGLGAAATSAAWTSDVKFTGLAGVAGFDPVVAVTVYGTAPTEDDFSHAEGIDILLDGTWWDADAGRWDKAGAESALPGATVSANGVALWYTQTLTVKDAAGGKLDIKSVAGSEDFWADLGSAKTVYPVEGQPTRIARTAFSSSDGGMTWTAALTVLTQPQIVEGAVNTQVPVAVGPVQITASGIGFAPTGPTPPAP